MTSFILGAAAWLMKNIGLIIGIVEQILKVLGGIVSLTPTRKDDVVVQWIEDKFNGIQGWIYSVANLINNK